VLAENPDLDRQWDKGGYAMVGADEYRAVFESLPDGILIVDDDGIILEVNSQVETLFGYEREELLGAPVERLLPSALRSAHRKHREGYAKSPHVRPMGAGLDLRGRRRDGTEFDVEVSLSPWVGAKRPRVLCSVRDITAVRRLRDFSEGAIRSVEDERRRIARDLHDDTAQRLATFMLKLRLLSVHMGKAAPIETLAELRDEIADIAEGVKRVARGLRPPELEEVGLAAAIQSHARRLHESSGIEVNVALADVDDELSLDARLAIYRMTQESLSNVVRHSGAPAASVTLALDDAKVTLIVEDEGCGFSPEQTSARGTGLGLIGLHERALMAGGQVDIDSRPGKGTRVTVRLPIVPLPGHVRH